MECGAVRQRLHIYCPREEFPSTVLLEETGNSVLEPTAVTYGPPSRSANTTTTTLRESRARCSGDNREHSRRDVCDLFRECSSRNGTICFLVWSFGIASHSGTIREVAATRKGDRRKTDSVGSHGGRSPGPSERAGHAKRSNRLHVSRQRTLGSESVPATSSHLFQSGAKLPSTRVVTATRVAAVS
jgi:hypothetical protein